MHSRRIVLPVTAVLLMLLGGCATSPPAPPRQPDAPAEMLKIAPPSGYFVTWIETILSRSPKKPTP